MRKFPKKIRKKRGTRTIGYGRVGQHRKTGQRAGRGKTTQWKKSKKSYYLKQKKLGFPDPDWDIGKKGFKSLIYRRIGTTLLNLWLRFLFKLNITDYSNGYVAIKKEYINNIIEFGEKINLYPYDYVLHGIPTFIIGKKLGYKAIDVFAPYIFRTQGETKIPFFEGWRIWSRSVLLSTKLFFKLSGKK